MPVDLLIRGGTVVDGTGAPAVRADVAIVQGRVTQIGLVTDTAGSTIDADGLVVAPGFFDVHTHYDCQALWDPLLSSSCWHGVTTAVMGNCGFSIAPGTPADSEYLMLMMATVEGIPIGALQAGLRWDWSTFGDYLATVRRRLGLNVGAYVGHSALRYYAMGPESYQRAATGDEIARMRQVLHESMAAGALGLSTSLSPNHFGGLGEPVPSRSSSREELIALSGVLKEFGRGAVGVDPPKNSLMLDAETQALLVAMSQAAGRPVLWSVLVQQPTLPDAWKSTLGYMEQAARRGTTIYGLAKCQPMEFEFNLRFSSTLGRLPAWKKVLPLSVEAKKRVLSDPAVRVGLRKDWDSLPQTRRSHLAEVARTKLPQHKALEGRRIVELAAQEGKHPVDYMIDLSLREDLATCFVFAGMLNADPNAVAEMIRHPYCVVGASDAGAHVDMDCGADFSTYLLGHWVKEQGAMTLEEGVRRLTSMPADVFGFQDRGRLRPGMAADVVVFDPRTIRPLPRETAGDFPGGGERIIQRAVGVHAVIVNGELLMKDGQHTGALPGRVVTPGAAVPSQGRR